MKFKTNIALKFSKTMKFIDWKIIVFNNNYNEQKLFSIEVLIIYIKKKLDTIQLP